MLHIINHTWFFIGLIMLILGTFITVFDYPQIQYFESMDSQMYTSLDSETKEIHKRLQIELSIGITILLAGGMFLGLSLFRKKR
jgi:hypothetical protein